jgi:hypothetical protein
VFKNRAGVFRVMRYAHAELDLKLQALAQVFPDVLGAPKAGGMVLNRRELITLVSAPVIPRGSRYVARGEGTTGPRWNWTVARVVD